MKKRYVFSVVEDPIAGFLYALRSPISKKKYPQRLRVFLRFLGFNGVFKDDALEFLKKAREDPEWVEDMLMQFISSQIEKLNRGEIASCYDIELLQSRQVIFGDE